MCSSLLRPPSPSAKGPEASARLIFSLEENDWLDDKVQNPFLTESSHSSWLYEYPLFLLSKEASP